MRQSSDLFEPFSHQGDWWVQESQKLSGTLSYRPGGRLRLELLGVFVEGTNRDGTTIPLIRGLARTGERITLVDCSFAGLTSSGTVPTVAFFCRLALIGDFFPTLEAFSGCAMRCDGLEVWQPTRPIEFTRENDDYTFNVRPRNVASLRSSDNESTVDVLERMRGTFNGRAIDAEVRTILEITPSAPRSLEWFLSYCLELRDLITLCFAAPTHVQHIVLFGENHTAEHSSGRERVSLYFVDGRGVGGAETGVQFPLVDLVRLRECGEDVLDSWSRVRSEAQAAIDLLITILHERELHLEVRFLLCLQAFEALHRASSPEQLVTDDQFADIETAMIEAIPSTTPNKLREKLVSVVEYANEPSLRQRLKGQRDELASSLGPNPLGLTNKEIGAIIDSRNYHTHYTDELRSKSLSGQPLYGASQRVIALIIMMLLQKLGVQYHFALQALQSNHNFRPYISTNLQPDA